MRGNRVIGTLRLGTLPLVMLLAACSGSGESQLAPTPPGPPPFTSVPQVQVSEPSTFGNCNGVAQPGTLYHNTAVEPFLAVDPTNTAHLIAVFQKDRWSNGGSQAQDLAVSFDGGATWMPSGAAFSVCTGGSPANAGNYLRASDGWLAVTPDGQLAFALSLAFSGGALAPGSSNAQLVARSIDGGVTWSTPFALQADGASNFNDKGSITADPFDANHVYAVWDRVTSQTAGPTYFAVTTDMGNSWQSARNIYDPGPTNQTLGNIIVVLPGDIVLDFFTEIDTAKDGTTSALLRLISSPDQGANWSGPITVAENESVGTVEPQTGKPIRDSSDLFSVSVSPGGVIYVTWQDSRFSAGDHDGIALTSSSDAGQHWSTPVQVNAKPAVAAFTPTIAVRADGVIGITYYDLRNDIVQGTVLIDCWMVTSSDGSHFTESHLSGPFDMALAPLSETGPNNTLGLFLGDYQGLSSGGGAFLPLYAQTNMGSQVSNDIFIAFPPASTGAVAQSLPGAAVARFRAPAAPRGVTLTPAARARMMEHIRRTQAGRLPQG
jgi:hypothetical protein